MMDTAPLAGIRILVVEDDFLLAWNEQETLEEAGAVVIGPCSNERSALSAAEGPVDCAVIDLNLGTGPTFKIAAALRAKDIPFVLVTGYDATAIPNDMLDVKRLQKPVDNRELVRAVCSLCDRG